MNRVVAGGLLFYASTSFALAQIQITEVMYDPAGSTTGREWVEVQNISESSIDFTNWKFFEANVNHGIASTTIEHITIEPQEFVVITTDRSKFLVDFPSFAGKIFKSSFSLSNSGENIAFKAESSGAIVDQYLYDVTLGGAGDGNSLQKNGLTWLAALPTPGLTNTSSGSGGIGGSTSTTTATTTPTATSTLSGGESGTPPPSTIPVVVGSGAKFVIPYVYGVISAPTVVLAGVEGVFSAQAFTGDGKEVTNAQFTWNFGDGTVATGKKVTHRYRYPGVHSVVLESLVSYGVSNTTATEYGTVVVVAPLFSIREEKDDESQMYVLIENKTEHKVDMSSWNIRRGENGEENYILPKNTFISPFTEIRIPQEVTYFKNDGVIKKVELVFPNGKIASGNSSAEVVLSRSTMLSSTNHVPEVIGQKIVTISSPTSLPVAKVASITNILPKVQTQEPKTEILSENTSVNKGSTTISSTTNILAAAVTTSGTGSTSLLWYAIPLLVLVIAGGLFLGRTKENDPLDGYTIIDDEK